MTWKRTPGPYSRPPVDRKRPMTDDTWMLVAIYLDEEGLAPKQIAARLVRDPDDFARQLHEGIQGGKLAEARMRLKAWGGVYARRMAGYRSAAGAT